MDLVTDLALMLTDLGVSESVYTFDRGDFEFDWDSSLIYTGNGLPDAAEFSLLERVLLDKDIEMAEEFGVSHAEVWEDYARNIEQAAADLGGLLPDYFQRVVAAYMTIGTSGMVGMITDTVDEYLGAELNWGEYGTNSSKHLAHDADADADGASNIEEWNNVVARLQEPLTGFAADATTSSEEDQLTEYANAAVDPTTDGSEGEGEGEGEGECSCPNDDTGDGEGINKADITLRNSTDI